MKTNNPEENINDPLTQRIKSLRLKALKKRKPRTLEQLDKPVSFWTKKDRLLKQVGKEFTIILRTKGCSWSLGEKGGCSMCGYVQDANIEPVAPEKLINQFNYALQNKQSEIDADKKNYVLKIFNSGSFFDDTEITKSVRSHIYEEISKIKNIHEVVLESRVEYITPDVLSDIKDNLGDKYVEIGIGLETVDDYFRNTYINKGLLFEDFKKSFELCKDYNVGVKSYLLFKPPFLNEQSAIDDCINSLTTLVNMNVNSISINPMNIQKGSFVEYLWYQRRYRPPWFYSLLKSIKRTFKRMPQGNVRVLSDPSGAGTKRGIHNCLKKECNEKYRNILQRFVDSQDVNQLKHIKHTCECKKLYYLQRRFH